MTRIRFHKQKSLSWGREIHICVKVIRRGSIIGHRINCNEVGVPKSQLPAKTDTSTPLPPPPPPPRIIHVMFCCQEFFSVSPLKKLNEYKSFVHSGSALGSASAYFTGTLGMFRSRSDNTPKKNAVRNRIPMFWLVIIFWGKTLIISTHTKRGVSLDLVCGNDTLMQGMSRILQCVSTYHKNQRNVDFWTVRWFVDSLINKLAYSLLHWPVKKCLVDMWTNCLNRVSPYMSVSLHKFFREIQHWLIIMI